MATEAVCRAFYARLEGLRDAAYRTVVDRVGDEKQAASLFVGSCNEFAQVLTAAYKPLVLLEYVGWHSLIGSTPRFSITVEEDLPLDHSVEAFYRRIIDGTEVLVSDD